MAGQGIPEEVKRLLADHIVSVEQLEILLLLRAHPHEDWTAARVSTEMRSSEISAGERLADLQARGFLDATGHSPPSYRYAPSGERMRRAVDLLELAYRERRFTVIELIFSKPIDNLRVYADAFRIRKDESDG